MLNVARLCREERVPAVHLALFEHPLRRPQILISASRVVRGGAGVHIVAGIAAELVLGD
jgi:hypothetical protein